MSQIRPLARDDMAERDATDPLAPMRQRFALPDGVIYLDGNSLGALPKATAARVAEVVTREWGGGLIRSWNEAGWIDLPNRVGNKVARLIGAAPDSVMVADSTSINLFKLLAAALLLRPGRHTILSEAGNFPTDLYIADGLCHLLAQGHRLETATYDEIEARIGDDTAVVMLTHVNYHTGRMFDMGRITRAAHARGALMLWDLAHSAGAVPVALADHNVDLAVGCGYKYLNGGPGAPAFLYAAPRLQECLRYPITGWLGHAAPFAFEPGYRPAPGIQRAQAGTPSVIAMSALEVGVDIALEVDMDDIRRKSLELSEAFIALVAQLCPGHDLRLISPTEAALRGSQVCLAHPNAYAIMQALIARGVIGDFRAPDVLRFGLTPLYLGFADVWDAVCILAEVLDSGIWRDARFAARQKVT